MPLMIMMKEGVHPGVMANTVILPQDAFQDAKDGDEIEFTGKGKIVEEEGKKVLMVNEVNGENVEEINPNDHEPLSSEEDGNPDHMDYESAMNKFFNKK